MKEGKSAKEIWPDEPNKAARKDVDARWTPEIGGKVRHRPDGTPLPMAAVPVFGCKSHISIDRPFGFIRENAVTAASAADGRMLTDQRSKHGRFASKPCFFDNLSEQIFGRINVISGLLLRHEGW